MNTTKAWYIRRLPDNEITGPFPAGQISQEILLGRHRLDDEVSHDKEEWIKLGDVAEILPSILTADSDDPDIQDRLAAARRWADERRGIDVKTSKNQRDISEDIKRLHDLKSDNQNKNSGFMTCFQIGAVITVFFAVIFLAFQYSPEKIQAINCSAEVKENTLFNGCDLNQVNLSFHNLKMVSFMNTHLYKANLDGANLFKANLKYAQLSSASMQQTNLSQANLKGANLLEANLSKANLSDADLSYADLRKANISETNFSNANLSNAIWIDGSTCKKGSLGICR